MPDPTSDILTGISKTDILSMQQDTKQRFDSLFSPVQTTPPDITQPKVPDFKGGVVDSSKNINIDVYDTLLNTTKQKFPDSFNYQPDVLVPQNSTRRYIDEDYGYKLDRDNEDFYAKQQGAFSEVMKAIFVKLPTYTFAKLGTGIGYLAGLVDPSNWGDNYISKAGDNSIAKFFGDLEDDLKNDWLTTYRHTVDRDKGFFERAATDLSFWTEDFVDGAAFLASAFVPGMLISKLGLGVKLGQAIGMVNAEQKASALMSGLGRSIAKYGDRVITTVINTASESMFEAKQVRDKVYEDLMATGNYSESEAKNIAAQKAKNTFLWNMGALAFSNAWETNIFYKALGKGSTKAITTKTTSLLEDYASDQATKAGGRGLFYGKKAAEGIFVEGLYEENIQLAIQRQNDGTGFYDGVLTQLYNQTRDAFSGKDKEASESIGMGSLIGLVFGTGTSALKSEYSQERIRAERLLNYLNDAKNNWLKTQDVYSVDGEGKLVEDKGKVAAMLLTQLGIADKLKQAELETNPVIKNLAKKDAFSSFVGAHLNQGSFDLLMRQLDDIHNYKPEDLIKLGFDPTGDVRTSVQEYKNYANRLKDIKGVIDQRVIGDDPVTRSKRDYLFGIGSNQIALEQELDKINTSISTLEGNMGYGSITDNLVNELNNKRIKIESQKATIENTKEEDKPKEEKKLSKYEKDLEKFKKENEEEVAKLKTTSDEFYLYDNDNKNKHPLRSELVAQSVNKAQVENSINDSLDEFNNIISNKKEYVKKYNEQVQKVEEFIEKSREIAKEKPKVTLPAAAPSNAAPKTEPVNPPSTIQEAISTTSPEDQQANYDKLLAKIPTTKNINVGLLNKLSSEINNASMLGLISPDHETALIDLLNSKNPVGTAMDTADDFKDDGKVTEASDPTPDITENGFDPTTNAVLDDDPTFSAIAWESSNKTITQEEVEKDGIYIGELDESPYKKFKQGFLRYALLTPIVLKQYRGLIIQDHPELPRDENSIDAPLGQVLVITDQADNILYFDKDYNPSTTPDKDRQALVYSFDLRNWEEIAETRALIGSQLTGLSTERFTEQYKKEAIEKEFARQLALMGIPVPVTLTKVSKGMIKTNKNLLDTKIVLGNQNFSIFIPQSTEPYDKDNPDKNKYIPNIDGQYLLNGAAYIETQRSQNEPFTYTRIIPNKISENPQLFEDLKSLLLFKYEEENEALIIKNYLNNILFLGYVTRPKTVLNLNQATGKYELAIIFNNEIMPYDQAVEFIADQRLNITKQNINSNFTYYSIKNGKIHIEEKENYNEFIAANSKTRARSLNTSEGKALMNINTYLMFSFDDSVETMKAKLAGEDAHPSDTSVMENTLTLEGLPSLIEKARALKNLNALDRAALEKDPLSFFEYLKQQALGWGPDNKPLGQNRLAEMERETSYGKEFISDLLAFFGLTTENASLIQDPIKRRPRKNTDLNDALIDEDNPLTSATNEDQIGRPFLDLSEALLNIQGMFGKDVAARIVEIYNSDASALWDQSGIKLFLNARLGDDYHESWHHFSQMFLTKKEKVSLYNEVRKRAVNFKTRDGRKLNSKNAVDIDIEEFMADDFRDYVLSKGKSVLADGKQRNTIFRKIYNFIMEFFFGRINIGELYEKLRVGDLNEYTPSINNAMWGKLNSSLINDLNEEIFDNKKAAYYRDVVSRLMGKILISKGIDIEALRSNSKLTRAIYDTIYNQLADRIDELVDAQDAGLPYNKELYEDLYKLTDNNNWNKFIRYHISKIGVNAQFDVEEILNSVANAENLGEEDFVIQESEAESDPEDTENPDVIDNPDADMGSDRVFDVGGNEVSSSDAAKIETKSLIRMLAKSEYFEGKFLPVIDHNGFEKLCDFSHVWNNLAIILADKQGYADMYMTLLDKQNQIRVPEIHELITNLPHPDNINTKQDLDRALAFYVSFDRSYVPIYSAKIFEGSNFYFYEETKRNANSIEKEWSSNFISLGSDNKLLKNGTILVDIDGRNYINPQITLNYNLNRPEEAKEFSELVGFTFSPETFKHQPFRVRYVGFLQSLQTNINQRLKIGQKIYNPVYDLKQDVKERQEDEIKTIVKGLSGTINAFLAIEAKFSSINPSMSYLNAEGNVIYALTSPMFLTKNANLINNSKTYTDLISKPEAQHLNKFNNPFVENSLFLNTIFNSNGSKNKINQDTDVQIIVGNYSGLKVVTEKGTKATSTTNLNTRDKTIMDISSLLTAGAIEIMRTEASKTSYFIKLNGYKNDPILPVPINEFASSFKSPRFISYMKGALKDELNRMKFADTVELYNKSPELLKAAKQFNIFRDILTLAGTDTNKNTERLKNQIKAELDTLSVDDILIKYNDDIETAILEFFQSEFTSFLDGLQDEGIGPENIPNNLINYGEAQLYRAFLANSIILNIEYVKLFDGDTIFQAHYGDFHKRSKGAISTGTHPNIDQMFVKYMQNDQHNTIAGFMGVAALNDYKTTRSLVVEDDKRDSVYTLHDIMANNLKKANPKISEEKVKEITNKYKGMTIGDGQGHITLDFYRQFLMSISNWSDEQELMYQKEVAWFRLNYQNQGQYDQDQMARDKEFLKKYEDLVAYFPPIKMQYNGPIKAIGTYAQVMDKFSVAPLIPSIIQGTPMEKQNIAMIKKGIGYSKFKSGTKKYSYPAHKAYTDAGFDMNLDNYEPPVHYLNFLKEQIHTAAKIKQESIFGSQIRKLIMANLFSNGAAREIDAKRRERYISLISNLHSFEKEKLFNELGLKQDKNVIIVEDLQRFVKNIQKQADLRELNDNVKDYIQYDKETNNVKYPLEASLNKKAIQGMLMGIIDRRIRKQTINGDMLIQVSSSGFENNNFKYTNPTEEEVRKYGTNDLRFYDIEGEGDNMRTTAMQVKVALVGGFENLLNKKHPDDNKIRTRERLNELLKNKEWMNANRQSVTMIGYRIPTQGINSMEFMEVAEFLDPKAGPIIIPPAEIVAKSGSDYDIDKMSIFRPSFSTSGNLVNNNTIKELEQYLKDLKDVKKIDILKNKFNVKGNIEALSDVLEQEDDINLDPETVKIKKEISRLRNSRKQIFSNEIIKLFTEILSDPAMYEQLITPNDTGLIKPISVEVAKAIGKLSKRDFDEKGKKKAYSGTQIIRWKNNTRKFESLTTAKKFLAIAAVNNAFMPLLHQADIGMNMSYNTKQAFRQVTRPVNLYLLDVIERQSILKNGRINISSKYNVHGELKQEYLSQIMNGEVDAASDDFMGYININNENINVMMYLLNIGVPYSRILWFINQPVMLQYYADLKSTKLYKSELQGRILGNLLGEKYTYLSEYEGVTIEKFDADKFNKAINQLLNGTQVVIENGKKVAKRIIPDNFSFTESKLKSLVTRDYVGFLDKPQNKRYQAAAFAYFITLQEQAGLFRNFQSVFNADTKKMNNQMEAFQLIRKTIQQSPASLKSNRITDNIINQGLFTIDDIQQIAGNSVISSFINNKMIIYQTVNKLMPYLSNAIFSNKAAQFISDQFLTRAKLPKVMSIIENDWIEYIIKSFGIIDGMSFATYGKKLLVGENTLAKRLINLRQRPEYQPLLEEFSFFGKLRTSFSTDVTIKQQNIEVQKLFEDTTDDQNRYITEFRQLINFSDRRFNLTQQQEIRKFFKDLAILGFAQSGFNRGPISFQELIPYEQMADLFKESLKTFEENIASNQSLNQEFVKQFINQFRNINPTLVSTKARSKQSWRGKDYHLTPQLHARIQEEMLKKKIRDQVDEINRERWAMLNPETDEEGNIFVKSKNLDNIVAGRQALISLANKVREGENTLAVADLNLSVLVNLSLFGEYRYNPEDGMVYRTGAIEGRDRDKVAQSIGYASFMEMTQDQDMLAFTAGLQTRVFYRVTSMSDKEKVEPKVEETTENILPSQENVVSSIMKPIVFEEDSTSGYAVRTRKNASADVTIAMAVDFTTAGEKLTRSSVENQQKAYIKIDANSLEVTQARVDGIVNILNSRNAKTLNIAGNGIYTMKGKYTQDQVDQFTYDLLKAVFESPKLTAKIELIRSGGQTGFDEAGIKAGQRLGFNTLILAPKGWKFRDINGKDISNEQAFKARFNQSGVTQGELFTSQEDPNNIYSKLGNKTVSNNVEIVSWADLKEYTDPIGKDANGNIEYIVSTRINKLFNHFGNPFSHDPAGKTQGLIKTATIKEAVEKYIDWVINSKDPRAEWIRTKLKSGDLKNKPILYYKELGEPSHATALDYLINEYNWNEETVEDLNDSPFYSDEEAITKGFNIVSSTESTPEQLAALKAKIQELKDKGIINNEDC